MLGELVCIPTDTLIDMLYIILAGDFAITANDATEIAQIQRELQRRCEEQCWSFQAVNWEKRAISLWMSVEPRRRRTLAEPQSVGRAQR
jgi:hypothetical protein